MYNYNTSKQIEDYYKDINIANMRLKEICGLNKILKKYAIEIIIESMLEDKEYDVISHIFTQEEFMEGKNESERARD